MITGDNPLTACHVAKDIRMTKKPHTLILTPPNEYGESTSKRRRRRLFSSPKI